MRLELKLFRDDSGVVVLECEAPSEVEAVSSYSAQGWVLLSARRLERWRPFVSSTTRFPLLIFAQELRSLLDAGLNLVESIDALRNKEPDESVRAVLAALCEDMRSGASFSRALQRHETCFPALFRAAIEASEQTGEVAQALVRFIAYESQFQALRRRLASAMVYPILLMGLGALVTLFLLVYVVPRFSVVFADRLGELPYLSGVVIRIGMLISSHPMVAALAGGLVVWAIAYVATKRSIRAALVTHATNLPVIGAYVTLYQFARLYRSLGLLLRGGIPAVKAMDMVKPLLADASRIRLQKAIVDVSEGRSLSSALKGQGLTNSVAERMLAAGERTGRMGEMLERTADFVDEEISRFLDRVIRLVEPAMMAIIGIVVGGIVILMYLPIFELADSIK